MIDGKLVWCEAFDFHQCHCQGVADCECNSCTCSRRQVQWASLLVDRSVQNCFGSASESGVEIADDRNNVCAIASDSIRSKFCTSAKLFVVVMPWPLIYDYALTLQAFGRLGSR